jgi:hypothetical protein
MAYLCPIFDRSSDIESGFVNIYKRGEDLEPGYCRSHRHSAYHQEKPAYLIRIKPKTATPQQETPIANT